MKHLKKSMFISTVLMVVMLIAALSTATFAWYTSNSNATSNAVQVGAAEATSANIGIGFMKGATANTITFLDLVDAQSKGDLDPVIPAKYYDQLNDNTVVPTQYTSSTQVPTAGFVAAGMYVASEHGGATYEAFVAAQAEALAQEQEALPTTGIGIDYKRIVNMTSAQVADIVAAADYTHDFSAGTLTNLTDIGDNYEQIYTVRKYAYNDTVTSSSEEGAIPAANSAIKVTSSGIYTVIDADFAPCYKVVKVFTVNNSGTEYADFDFATTTVVSQSCAYTLSGNSWFPAENGYLVAYNVYATANYKADVTAIDTTAVKVGYAANTAATLNAGDILASVVTSGSYPTITDILYNSNNFAYVAMTYAGSATDNGALTNKKTVEQVTSISYDDFKFNKGSIDGAGYFQQNGAAATIGAKYTGTGDYATNAYDIAVLQGRDSRGTAVQTFYVTNNGSTTIDNLSVSLTTDGDNAALLRVALFKDGNYVGTLAGEEGALTAFGTIYAGAAAKDLPTYAAHQSYDLGALEAGNAQAAEFQVVVWFDGNLLDDAQAGKNATFVLNFHA